MKRTQILDVLKSEGEPISINKLSNEINEPISSLRIDLYRLQEEGEVEGVQKEGELKWKLKVSNPAEEKYEKMSKKFASDD